MIEIGKSYSFYSFNFKRNFYFTVTNIDKNEYYIESITNDELPWLRFSRGSNLFNHSKELTPSNKLELL